MWPVETKVSAIREVSWILSVCPHSSSQILWYMFNYSFPEILINSANKLSTASKIELLIYMHLFCEPKFSVNLRSRWNICTKSKHLIEGEKFYYGMLVEGICIPAAQVVVEEVCFYILPVGGTENPNLRIVALVLKGTSKAVISEYLRHWIWCSMWSITTAKIWNQFVNDFWTCKIENTFMEIFYFETMIFEVKFTVLIYVFGFSLLSECCFHRDRQCRHSSSSNKPSKSIVRSPSLFPIEPYHQTHRSSSDQPSTLCITRLEKCLR